FSFGDVALSADGRVLAATIDGQGDFVRLWEAATGKEIRSVPVRDRGLRFLAFSPDGKSLAVAFQNTLRLWDASTGKERWHYTLSSNQFFGITFSPDGRTLAAALVCMVRLWDVPTGREICPIPEHRLGIGSISLSPDGRTLTTEGYSTSGIPGSGGVGDD